MMATFDRLAPRIALGAFLVSVGLGTAWAAEQTQMYRCEKGGSLVFSDHPCGEDAREVDVQYDEPTPDQAEDAESRARDTQEQYARQSEQKGLDGKIKKLQDDLAAVKKERDDNMAILSKRLQGPHPADDDSWEERTRGQMEALSGQYKSRIETMEQNLATLQKQRAAAAQ